jgi:hypothetical protein
MPQITDANLFELFAGKGNIDKIRWSGEDMNFFVNRLNPDTGEMEESRCCITQNDFQNIREIFTDGSLKSLSHTEYLLLILWIREVRFMKGSLQDIDRLEFVQNAFAFSGNEIDEPTVRLKFQELLRRRYISEGITGENQVKDYFLTEKGTSTTGELLDKMKEFVSAHAEVLTIDTEDDSPVASDKMSTKALTIPAQDIKHNKMLKGLLERFPEIRAFNSSQLLLYYKSFAKKQGIEIKITEGRIRQLPVWKENAIHRMSGKTQYREEMGDALDEDAVDVNDSDYEMADS